MADDSIRHLLTALQEAYPGAVKPYASTFHRAEDEHGLSWRFERVPATFSAITFEGTLPADTYDVQIESAPPGDYIFNGRYRLDELLQLVKRYFGPEDGWPSTA